MPRYLRLLWSLCLVITTAAAYAGAKARIICRLNSGVNPALVAGRFGMKVSDAASGSPFVLMTADGDSGRFASAVRSDARVTWSAADQLVPMGEVDTVARGGTIPVVGNPTELTTRDENLLSQIDWNSSLAPDSLRHIRVAVLDTGLSYNAPWLWTHVAAYSNAVESGSFPSDGPYPPLGITEPVGPATGHGTMVAGLINMVAPNADLLICKVAGGDGSATLWSLVKGIVFAARNGAQLCNVSLATPNQIDPVGEVVKWAAMQGVVFVGPIGNDDDARAYEPSALDGFLCVAGVDVDDTKASFSNYSTRADVCAPATQIISTNWDGNLAEWAGTSFSAPLVTGALAVRFASDGHLNAWQCARALQKSGKSVDGVNPLFAGQLGKVLDVSRLLDSQAEVMRTRRNPRLGVVSLL